MSLNFLGIDIGGTHIRSLAEVSGSRLRITRAKVATTLTGLVDQVVELGAATNPVTVGITLPGRIENNNPAWIPNLPFLDGRDFVSEISKKMDAKITLINDAQAALLAEAREGSAIGLNNVVLIAIGTGIGGAVLVNGEIFPGSSGTAGSFGWMPSQYFDARKVRGPINSGPWESASSGSSLLELAGNWTDIDALLADFRIGDLAAIKVIVEFSERIGEGLAAIASVFDPDLIVFAGGVSAMLNELSQGIDLAIAKIASPTGRSVPYRQAALGVDAGVVGALLAGKGRGHK